MNQNNPLAVAQFIHYHKSMELYRRIVGKTLGVQEPPSAPVDVSELLLSLQQQAPALPAPAPAPTLPAALPGVAAKAASLMKPLLLTALMGTGIGGIAGIGGAILASKFSPPATINPTPVNINPAEWDLKIKELLDKDGKPLK